jgi:hypothetical protein
LASFIGGGTLSTTTACNRHRLIARGLQLSFGPCEIASKELTRRSPPLLLLSMLCGCAAGH